MLKLSILFPLIIFAIILLFFSALPDLRFCELPGNRPPKSTRKDRLKTWSIVFFITIIYAVTAFYHLGNTKSPQSFAEMLNNPAVIKIEEDTAATNLLLFPGVGIGTYSIEVSEDAEGWIPVEEYTQDHVSVLKWQNIRLSDPITVPYIRINCTSGDPWLGETGLLRDDGGRIKIRCSLAELTDEQELLTASTSYMDSSYFDEIYHARTAWEHLHGIWPYEISHPPLGKEILSLGILLFGMTPFGWRFSGVVFGILMIPLMFLFLQRMFCRHSVSVLGTVLLASEFLHYTQTRIATIDSYAVFFILLMYYFMFGWLKHGKLHDLALCGIAFGFGAASKWICLYAGAGLAVLWLIHWIVSAYCCPSESKILFLRNCGFCVIFFLLVPVIIYYISYLPYGAAKGCKLISKEYLQLVLDNQSFMFRYHAGIVADHPYSSRWYQWILDIRPILYYLEYLPDGNRMTIAAFVNPLICWTGLLSLFVLLYMLIVRHDRISWFLLIAYASGIIPWMFISRLTFEYHYFASALFLIPMICYLFSLIEEGNRNGVNFNIGFTACAVLLFVMFFPVLNGIPVDNIKASELLGWLPTWPI